MKLQEMKPAVDEAMFGFEEDEIAALDDAEGEGEVEDILANLDWDYEGGEEEGELDLDLDMGDMDVDIDVEDEDLPELPAGEMEVEDGGNG